METTYRKENDYTLLAISQTPGRGTVTRYFNFAARQVLTLYERKEELSDKQGTSWGDSGSSATAVSVALASEMTVQKFSELDSLDEARLMRDELLRLKGNPPLLDVEQDKKSIAPPKLSAVG